jgi:uncharacterized membrane protein HdeD (DUF308 family)
MTILGVLMIILGFSCAVTPLATFVAAGYFIAVVLISSGLSGIIAWVRFRIYGVNFAVSILALILGILALSRPGGIAVIDTMLIYLFSAWLVVRGAASISFSLKLRKFHTSNGWILGLITGVLGVVLGIYSFVYTSVPAITLGLLISMYFIEEGIGIIAMSRVVKEVSDAVNDSNNTAV